ncbi:transmembrane amino acid transporter [Colletotrichum scovillei]|uniref:Amino acid transporter n=1 Tax=Colletotrichum scovillei TaxID=1209932 RepID=A0A9P7R9Y9_9PEZI|nr:transmembrane amino acid transporter [Colletotrichum scovillei]KAF4776081.1 transmembrane amino acid transporter [Colletotrichum scovillei]KAG7053640.1 amino acid transporter [Colletotrichum scovillei]KAG7071938.1 amino acid transporter [Colletotrichum scovillei]KAG7080181.1 amino acid transporter [Colletotrichum scovillei]
MAQKNKEDVEALGPVSTHSQQGQVLEDPNASYDAVFGEIKEGGPNYRNVGWKGTVALMMKTQIGLGVLSIPGVFDVLGIVPGVIALCCIAAITTWSDYIVGVFKLRHPEVYGIDDVGRLLFGRVGREFFGIVFCLYWIFVAGSGMLGASIALNSVSLHGACTAGFVAIAAAIGFCFGSIQTLGKITWFAWVGLICIMSAIFTVTVAVGVQDRPAAAPQTGHWTSDYKVVGSPTFAQASSALSTLVFAFAGTPAFFSIVSEMRDPRHYTRALVICQGGVTATYIAIGCVVYYFCGSYVASPALGSAGATMKRVCYGLAFPGLIVTTTLVIHLPAKYIFIRLLRGSRHLTENTMKHWGIWLACTASIAITAYVIASSIPVFDGLVSLVGALFGTLLSFQPMGCMWLYDHWAEGKLEKRPRWIAMVCFSCFVVISGTFLMIAGAYGSVVGIMDSYKKSGGSAAFSCADNSNSVSSAH